LGIGRMIALSDGLANFLANADLPK
jgi:hypothetical protein